MQCIAAKEQTREVATEVTVINKFAISPEAIDAFLAEFRAHRDLLAAQPGFLDGALYRKVDGPGRFTIVNLARWGSVEALRSARDALVRAYAARGEDPSSAYRRLGVEADLATYQALESY
ncbi:antibiotic biosynthesis monooxygenase family protein [Afifella pfennigii]|uniref:antibiotic biosynthesis monooxygenase family protein n=1 Tax=Afifella pfennigii TaxID=209897 RepID=UPI00047B395C|nr:antibiotic biosynthesis monooxygenase family protein [Afifella pfennigii]